MLSWSDLTSCLDTFLVAVGGICDIATLWTAIPLAHPLAGRAFSRMKALGYLL